MLQGKGGIGKTWVASLLAQYLRETDRTPICFDTDPVNASLMAFQALGAESITLLEDDAINVDAVDAMIERAITADVEIVMDNGAASFIPLSRYLIADNIAELVDQAGKQMMVHVILVGGGGALETARGLEAVLTQFPQTVKVVVWVNEFFGPVVIEGTPFEDTNFYEQNRHRLAGVIHLRQQNPHTTGQNLSEMLSRKLTFAEALADGAFMLVPRQRLSLYRRAIWEQLASVI